MPDRPASSQSGTGLKKTNDAGTGAVPEQNDAVRHFLLRYRTEMTDTGIPMPALVFWMPMPTYDNKIFFTSFGHLSCRSLVYTAQAV
jgi:hypothetical protein